MNRTIVYCLTVMDKDDRFIRNKNGESTITEHWQLATKAVSHASVSVTRFFGVRFMIGYLIPLEDDDEKT